MGSGSGGPYADVSSKRLRAMAAERETIRDPNKMRLIQNELRVRDRISEQDRVRKARS